jgi:hypothetical protein
MSKSTIPDAIYYGLQRAAGITKILPGKLPVATDTALINCITPRKTSLIATDIINQQEFVGPAQGKIAGITDRSPLVKRGPR